MTNPFAVTESRLGDDPPPRPAERVQCVETPAGDPVWVINDPELAVTLAGDRRISKDPAFAPAHWSTGTVGLEPPSSVQPSLTTLDGPAHRELRRAHGPLFTARRVQAHAARTAEIARAELAAAGDDLMTGFAVRYPLAVVCDLLGVPARQLDDLAVACAGLLNAEPETVMPRAMELTRLVATALDEPGSAAAEFRARLGAQATDEQTAYYLFGLVFAGQITTSSALGFTVAHYLAGHQEQDDEEFVRAMLHRFPPAPFTLWRFSTEPLTVDEELIPARSPLLVNIEAANAAGADLTFGAGAHYCIGAQLAQLELVTLIQVLRTDYPQARLTVPVADLPVLRRGTDSLSLRTLPVCLSTT